MSLNFENADTNKIEKLTSKMFDMLSEAEASTEEMYCTVAVLLGSTVAFGLSREEAMKGIVITKDLAIDQLDASIKQMEDNK